MSAAGDADRLAAIADLERAIRARQPDLLAARQAATTAAADADRWRKAARAIDGQMAGIGRATLGSSRAVYLHGQVLDAGRLELGHEEVRYRGWRGEARARLASVVGIEVGQSNLPARAGVPLLGRFWPGPARPRGALIFNMADDGAQPSRRMVFAGLAFAEKWRAGITAQRERVGEIADQRAALGGDLAAADDQRRAAEAVLTEKRSALTAVEVDVKELTRQRDELQRQQRQVEQARRQAAQREVEALKQKGKGKR